jgi:hypothetical protein
MLVLVAGMGSFYYLHDVKGKPERDKAETEQRRFFPKVAKSDVTSVKLEKLSSPAYVREFALDNGVWVAKSNPPMVLRTSAVGSSIKNLVELERADNISEGEGQLNRADFGLDKPSFRITLADKKKQSHSLWLGGKTPDESGYYGSTQEKGDIWATNVTLSELLDASLDSLRETSPIAFEPSTANKLTVENGKGLIEVGLAEAREQEADSESDDGIEITDMSEKWKLLKPSPGEADATKVRDLINQWRNVKLGRFMQGNEKVDFSHPISKLTVFVDGQSKPFVLEIAGPVPGKANLYYAHRSPPDEYMVLEIPEKNLLETGVIAVQQRHIFNFEPEDAAHLKADLSGLTVEASKGKEGWKVSKPAVEESKRDAQGAAASDLVWELKNVEWIEQPAAPKEWKDRAWLELLDSKKKSIARLTLGPAQGEGCYVKDGSGKVYRLEKDPFKRWSDIKLRLEARAAATPTPKPAPLVIPGQ